MSPTQRRILWLMRRHDETVVACTGKGARLNGFGSWLHNEGGLVVRAYQDPLYFMATTSGEDRPKPWLEPVERNTPGRWYRLTEAGQQAAASIREEPPVPPRNTSSHFGAKGFR